MDDRCRLSFSTFFSTISNFSGQMLRKSILGRPGGSGRASGGVRGVSGRPLGRSWGSPGGSGGPLGRVLGALGAILERPLEQSDFGSIF